MLFSCALVVSAICPSTANAQERESVTPSAEEVSSPEKMLDYIRHHPRDVAFVSYSVKADGSVDTRNPIVSLNANVPMPLASTQKIVLLAAYARERVFGRVSAGEQIPVSDWERNYLAGTDGGSHARALGALGIPSDEYGFARSPNLKVRMDQLVWAMIEFSDNAAPDWLFERIGPQTVLDTIAEGGMNDQEPFLSLVGLMLACGNHEIGPLTERRLRTLAHLPAEELAAEVQRWHDAFQDLSWRMAELQWLLQGGSSAIDRPLFARAEDEVMLKGTARDYAHVMSHVITGTFISPEVSRTMRSFLEWPMQFPNVRAASPRGEIRVAHLTGEY